MQKLKIRTHPNLQLARRLAPSLMMFVGLTFLAILTGACGSNQEDPTTGAATVIEDHALAAEVQDMVSGIVPIGSTQPGQADRLEDLIANDYKIWHIQILWGNLLGFPTDTETSFKDSSISVTYGNGDLSPVANIFFETEQSDLVQPQHSQQNIEFDSTTSKRYDGLILRYVTKEAPQSGTLLELNLGNRQTFPIVLSDEATLQSINEPLDALGNRIAIQAVSFAPCNDRLLLGLWEASSNQSDLLAGTYGGLLLSPENGQVSGYMLGYYGQNNGTPYFTGSIFDTQSHNLGGLVGTYAGSQDGLRAGSFEAAWYRTEGPVDQTLDTDRLSGWWGYPVDGQGPGSFHGVLNGVCQ